MKRYAEELLQHERSTIQVKPDGTVIITPHLHQLPNEILARIIHYVLEPEPGLDEPDSRQMDQQLDLCTCTLVNKQFYAIAYPLLWREPLQRMMDYLATKEEPPMGHYVRTLDVDNITCTDTELLHLQDDFLSALSNCPLKKIRMCHIGESILTEKLVMDMTRFQDLTDLNLTIYEPSGLIMTIANNLQQKNKTAVDPCWLRLQVLNLECCDDIDDATFICFIKTHPDLQVLRLDNANLTNASLDAMAVSLHGCLRKVLFNKVHGISAGGVRRWIQNCQGLVFVKFRHCHQIVKRDVLETCKVEPRGYLILKEHDILKIRHAQETGNVHG
ncbi:hypothetical protein BCR42DRAFT_426269 [Absidia repens]|uniref:F-box domain-containing protein n=1 Tax=Absidia repens TaxID=90262 RepID=A0A1X2I205_9FUNG|nr:hypothetical protein BCR42DRAFT_426269 [Absidia repens]